jgi:opacity protein-like surface antigen
MAKQPIVVLFALIFLLACTAAGAQEQEKTGGKDDSGEKVFNLIVDADTTADIDEDLADEPRFEPAIESGQWDLTLTLGYFLMGKTLLQHENIIYKATAEDYFYGDVELKAQSAFNPMLRLGYTLTPWLTLELAGGLTFAEYDATISNAMAVNPEGGEPGPVDEVGEFDPEHRSMVVATGNVMGLWYPLNMDGDGRGRWHPYLTGGAGVALYNIDSNYTDSSATSTNLTFGGGLKLIADDLVTIRAEVLYHIHTMEFSPAENFDSQDAGTVNTPVYEFDNAGNYTEVESYGSETLGGLTWQIGFGVNF